MNLWNFEFSIDVDVDLKVMSGKIYGVWKKDTALAYAKELKEAAEPLVGKPWVKLMDLTNWKIAHQEVISIIGDLNHWCRENDMAWTVYIINQPTAYNQLMKMFTAGRYSDIGKTFRNYNEGVQFLKEKGYSLDPKKDNGLFK